MAIGRTRIAEAARRGRGFTVGGCFALGCAIGFKAREVGLVEPGAQRGLAAAQRLADQLVGEHEAGVADVGQPQRPARRLVGLGVGAVDQRRTVLDTHDDAAEALASLGGDRHLDFSLMARPTAEIARANQRPVDTR